MSTHRDCNHTWLWIAVIYLLIKSCSSDNADVHELQQKIHQLEQPEKTDDVRPSN